MLRMNLILALMISLGGSTGVYSQNLQTYHEDFTTTDYRNETNTTATWSTGDGEIHLAPFSLGDPVIYNTSGSARGIMVSGDVAYVADYTRGLVVLDISDPDNPTQLDTYDTPGYARTVVLSGDILCLGDGYAGLQLLDVSNPSNVSLVGNIDPSGDIVDLAMAGTLVYVASYTGGINIIDIADPANPVLIGSYSGMSATNALDIQGDLLYVVNYLDGLHVLDVSDPAAISEVGFLGTAGSPSGVSIDGNLAFVADKSGGLLILDIKHPTAPSLVNTVNTGGDTQRVSLAGDYAYVSDFNAGMLVLDVQDPLNVGVLETVAIADRGFQVVVAGEYVYLAAGSEGVDIFRAATPANMSWLASYALSGPLFQPVVEGNLAFLPGGNTGLTILDISDPENPQWVSQYWDSNPENWDTRNVDIEGDVAYVADLQQGLLVVDISNPANPILRSTGGGACEDVVVLGDFAITSGYDSEFGQSFISAFDISDLDYVYFEASFWGVYEGYGNLCTNGELVFVTMENDGVWIGFYNQQTLALQIESIADIGLAVDITLRGDHAFVAAGAEGIKVLDVSDPALPVLVTTYLTQSSATAVTVHGNHLFVSENGGLERVDISDPANPILVEYLPSTNSLGGVALAGDFAFVGHQQTGLGLVGAFQRRFDPTLNVGESTVFATAQGTVVQARLTTTQVDDVSWELRTADDGPWQPVMPGDIWNNLIPLGQQLSWRATLEVTHPLTNPNCSDLVIDLYCDIPTISSLVDVPGDQGRQLSLSWFRSGYDYLGSSFPIQEYSIFRRIEGTKGLPDKDSENKAYPPGDWHFVLTVPADAEDSYSVVVPSLGDSTVTDGQYMSSFFVRARTYTPGLYFDAPVDSGYTLDNLAPSVPSGMIMAGLGLLTWEECPEGDFRFFTVYGSDHLGLDETAQLIGQTTGLSLDVSGQNYSYLLLTATDFAGNESGFASLDQVSAVAESGLPNRFALTGNYPNPFNPATVISFDLAADSPVRLTVYDVSGRMVRTLLEGRVLAAGSHEQSWDGRNSSGQLSAAGVYLYRIEAGDYRETRRMTLVK